MRLQVLPLIVRCANCHTEFSLDDQQIGPEGATVRCSVCSYVFAVEPPPGSGEHPWQIRTVEDLLFTAPDLATLRTWIAEGRLHPDDQVSRTGKHWLRLGDMPEFSSAFSGFSNLPQVFEEIDPPAGVSALEELGPPPGFGETMPVIQGVDTDILVVRPERPGEYDVPVTARAAAVERALDPGRSPLPPPPPPNPRVASFGGETSGPEPFPLAELPVVDDDDEPPRPGLDESAVRMRPRPPAPSDARAPVVSAVPSVVDDAPVEELRRRPVRPTVRYGAEEVHGPSSMLDAVTSAVDDDVSDDGAEVRPTAAAVERAAVSPREPSGMRRAAVPVPRPPAPSGPRPVAAAPVVPHDASSDEVPVVRSRRSERDELESFDDEPAEPSRRSRSASREPLDDSPPRRSAWPLVAALGVLAGVAVVFGVPSIRAKVLGVASDVAGGEAFDPATLAELEQARAAMASLDPAVLGQAEAALQGRLDAGNVPPAGVAAMQLAQAELLATRALDHAIGRAAGVPAAAGPTDDVERATQILGALVPENVVDRDHMRRVRALVRLAQGRTAAEIVPLLPESGSDELRRLVEAGPLWHDALAPVPEGVVGGLEGLPERSTLAQLALALAYLRAGDEAKAQQMAEGVLGRVPNQPTALALRAKATGAAVASAGGAEGKVVEGKAVEEGKAPEEGKAVEGKAVEGKAPEDAGKSDGGGKSGGKAESTDSLIDRGCRLVESGDAGEGLDVLRRAKARRANDLDLLVCIGKGLAKQGRLRDALESYEDALRVSPRFAEALQSAARAADKLGETDKAVRYYRRLLAERPGDAKALAYVEAHGS